MKSLKYAGEGHIVRVRYEPLNTIIGTNGLDDRWILYLDNVSKFTVKDLVGDVYRYTTNKNFLRLYNQTDFHTAHKCSQILILLLGWTEINACCYIIFRAKQPSTYFSTACG